MPIPRSVKRYAAGTDTRNQFTTPPDQRQVEDLMLAFEDPIVGAMQKRTSGYSTQFTHNSGSGTWDTVDVSSGGHFWTDGNMDTTGNCYGPCPADWYSEWTYLCFDVPWAMDFPSHTGSYYMGVRVVTKLYASPFTVKSTTECYYELIDGAADGYALLGSASGTASVRLESTDCIQIQVLQSKGATMAMDFQWGTRLVCGTD